MNKVFIKTADAQCCIKGETIVKDDDTYFIYDGERLTGVFKSDIVQFMYSSEAK